jgi:hypothetical protein
LISVRQDVKNIQLTNTTLTFAAGTMDCSWTPIHCLNAGEMNHEARSSNRENWYKEREKAKGMLLELVSGNGNQNLPGVEQRQKKLIDFQNSAFHSPLPD